MFDALRIFEVREPISEDYQVPALDTVGTGNSLIVLPPPAPVVLSVDATDLIWENMLNVTGFVVESLGAGNIWSIVATLPPAPSVRILWTGVEWQIQKEVGNTWEVLYRGFQPLVPGSIVGDTALYQTILTPDLIPVWYLPDGVTVATGVGVTRGGILDPNGMQVVGTSESTVNVSYDMPGPQNGRNSYSGPELYDYSSSFASATYFRVRAINSAGEGAPSNIVSWSAPGLDWTQLLWGQDGFPEIQVYGTGSVVLTPNTGASDSEILAFDVEGFDDFGNVAQQVATLAYNGPAINCKLTLNISGGATTDIQGQIRVGTGAIFGPDDGSFVNQLLPGLANGTYDYPFTIPDTGGSPVSLLVWIQVNPPSDISAPYSFTVTASFSNV